MLSVFNILELFACLVPIFYYFCINNLLFQRTAMYRWWTISFFCVLYVCITFFPYSFLQNTYASLFGMVILLSMSVIIYSGNVLKKIAVLLIFNIADISVTILTYQLFSRFFQYEYLELTTWADTGRFYYLTFLYLVEGIIVYITRYLLSGTWNLFPHQFVVAGLFFFADFSIVLISYYTLFSLNEENKIFAGLCCTISIFMIIGSILVYYLLHMINNQNQKLMENQMLQLELSAHKKELELYQKSSEKISIERHNLKNRLLNYQILLEQEKSDEVLADISQVLKHDLSLTNRYYCSDPVINALLRVKGAFCNDNGIDFQVRIQLSKSFQNLDFLLIIDNLLDNAIEASAIAKIEKKIVVELTEVPLGYSLIVQNAIDTSVLDTNPELKTTKSDAGLHGFGLKSVRQLIEKRNGLFEVYEENHFFTVHILY